MDRPVVSLVPPPGQRSLIAQATRDRPVGVICSLATGRHRELLAESAPTMSAYAHRHGWDVVLSSEDLEPARPASWAKIRLIRELLPRYDHVFWVDADAIIVDLDRDVLAETDADSDIWFARHPQERNPDATVLNAGIILARSTGFVEQLLGKVWEATEFIDHNWWENAALLDLLGYSLDPPYLRVRESAWEERIGELALAWNSVPGYCEADHPALNHHARSDHDDFGRRLAAMAQDRRSVVARWPADFGYPPDAGRRDHEFVTVPQATEPSTDELVALVDRLDGLNELQRLKLFELYDLLETAVTEQVNQERRAESVAGELVSSRAEAAAERNQRARVETELAALRSTKLFRAAAPLRAVYARMRGRS